MADPLNGKVALVTGAASGIGAAIARKLAAEGATVCAADVNMAGVEDLCAALSSRHRALHLDVSSEDSFASAIGRVIEQFGRLDILVNNAGIVSPAVPVQDTSMEAFDSFVAVNLRGVFLGCRLAYPYLRLTRGCVLNISSMAGINGQASHAVYAATKGAINALTKSVATDWGPDGIRINALCPMGVWTDGFREWMAEQADPKGIEEYLKRIHALNYCPEAAEIASVAAFLCGDEARFVTGCLMPVSGGGECGYRL